MGMGRTQSHATLREYHVGAWRTNAYTPKGAAVDYYHTFGEYPAKLPEEAEPPKLYLRMVPLTRDGYEQGDPFVYWGFTGQTLYEYHTDDGEIYAHLRADTRAEAKTIIKERYPNARFFR